MKNGYLALLFLLVLASASACTDLGSGPAGDTLATLDGTDSNGGPLDALEADLGDLSPADLIDLDDADSVDASPLADSAPEAPDTTDNEDAPSDLANDSDATAADGTLDGGGLDASSDTLLEAPCVPDCSLRDCGDDGCGGSCGNCHGNNCDEVHGICQPRSRQTVVGQLLYELRYPEYNSGGGLELTGPKPYPASGMPALAMDADGTTLARGEVNRKGYFRLDLPRPARKGDLLIFPCMWNQNDVQSQPAFAIGRPRLGGDPREGSSDLWAFQATIPADGDVGTVTIAEADGSAVINIFIEARFAFAETLRHLPPNATSRTRTLGIMWGPGLSWSCGSCFSSELQQTIGGVGFNTSIFFGDDGSGSTAFCDGTILHEVGHHMAYSHFRDDSRGGVHYIGEKIHPAFAWSEGFASFFAIAIQSIQYGQAYPVLWQINGGSSFWMDFSRMVVGYSGGYGAYMEYPDPGDDIKQYLREDYVTSALWDFLDGATITDLEDPPDGIALDLDGIFLAISSRRMMVLDRGAHGADLVDFFDAAICTHASLAMDIYNMIISHLGFPYSGLVLCN
jgi:hypothetical protein